MSYNQMTPYRVTNDGQNLPVSWIKKETLAEAGAGDWLVFPQEAGCVEVTIDATAGCGYIQYTPDVESVLADETPDGITTWEQGEVASAVKSVFMFAGGAIRLVNRLGSVTMIALAKKQGSAQIAEEIGSVMATGTIAISALNAEEGNTIVLNDGVHAAVTFEFDDNDSVGEGNIGVSIGADNIESMALLVAAIEDADDLDITPSDNGDGSCFLRNDIPGAAGNETITKTGTHITVTGMADGKDAVTIRAIYDLLAEIAENTKPE